MGRNGRVVQGFPPIIEAQEKQDEDVGAEDEEEDEGMSVSLPSERNQAAKLKDTGGKSPQSQASQNSKRSRRKSQEITLSTLDPSNLSPR